MKQGKVKEENLSAVCSQSNLRLLLGIFRRQICSIPKFIDVHCSFSSFSSLAILYTHFVGLFRANLRCYRRWLAEHLEELQEEREKGLGTPVPTEQGCTSWIPKARLVVKFGGTRVVLVPYVSRCSPSESHCWSTPADHGDFDSPRPPPPLEQDRWASAADVMSMFCSVDV